MAELNAKWLDPALQFLSNYSAILLPAAAIVAVGLMLSRFLSGQGTSLGSRPGSRHVKHQSLTARFFGGLTRAFTTNWQLTLLATTAFVLSLASGWTTWDGMRNFTGEPILSLMVTFGIQGVMLIIAWLIGESFASGMSQRSPSSQDRRDDVGDVSGWSKIEPAVGMLVGTLFALTLFAAVANSLGAFGSSGQVQGFTWTQFADKAIYLGVGLLLIATLIINNKSDIAQPYVQSARIMAKNAVLWVMFLSCMATSVFFSFDSLFTSIFPQSERQRAADIRAVNQVAGVVADIGALTQRRQAEEADRLFQSDGWKVYEKSLGELSKQSQGAEKDIENYFVQQMEGRRRGIAEQQERIASATSGQAGLTSKKATLTDELSRIKGERPTLAAELAEKKTELENRNKAIDAKRVEAMAEERGAEGTLKVGKGPQYRERVGELGRMQDAVKIQDERVRDAQKRLGSIDTRIAQIERELAAVDGDIAKLKGEAQTAESRIKVAEQTKTGDEQPKVDPARVRSSFERSRAEFRQDPTVERLGALANQCTQLYNAMVATPATKERVRGIDCDPKQASEASGRVFALNAGLEHFSKNCAGGDKLPQTGGTDALLSFGRKCLQDSGLPSRDSGELGAKMSAIDLNRDDKAHRFVVTWNAFQDGNRLAYLALAIAIAIDSLVFMSGLFGANAVRSPLTEIRDRGEMTADQLESIVNGAIDQTAHPRATLNAIFSSLHPIQGSDGFTSEIVLDEGAPLIDELRHVLNIARTIGAVRPVGQSQSRFHLHSGLVRHLGLALKKTPKLGDDHFHRKELVNVIGVALLPDPQGNAEVVLSELHPISDAPGFAAETYPFKIVDTDHKRLMLNVLGAGATVPGAVKRFEGDGGRYFVSTDVYKTLLMMRAAAIPAFRSDPRAIAASAESATRRLEAKSRPLQAEQPRALEAPRPAAQPETSFAQPHQTQTPGPRISATPPPMPPMPSLDPEFGPANDDFPRVAKVDGGMAGNRAPKQNELDALAAGLGSRIRAELIQLGGLHAWSDREIALAVQLGENSEPEQALRRLSGRAPHLAKLVGDAINEYQASVQGAYDHLRAIHEHDGVYLQVLETVAGELAHLMPLLMLSPGGPYQQILERIIYDLTPDNADDALSPAQKAIYERAKQQITALNGLSDNDPHRLGRIADIIDRYKETNPAQAQWEQPDKRTLN